MRSPHEIIKSPLITEKLQVKNPLGIYGFWVDRTATKVDIKRALEKIYSVNVTRVNVVTVPGKKKRLRFKEGYTPSWKKAVIRVKKGQTINIG